MLQTYSYDASDGKEFFLTFEDPEDRTIFSLLRLRIPSSIISPESQQIFEMRTKEALKNSTPPPNPLPTREGEMSKANGGGSIPNYLPELT